MMWFPSPLGEGRIETDWSSSNPIVYILIPFTFGWRADWNSQWFQSCGRCLDSLHLWVKGGLKQWSERTKLINGADSLHLWVKGGLKLKAGRTSAKEMTRFPSPLGEGRIETVLPTKQGNNWVDSLHLWVKGGLKQKLYLLANRQHSDSLHLWVKGGLKHQQ